MQCYRYVCLEQRRRRYFQCWLETWSTGACQQIQQQNETDFPKQSEQSAWKG